MAWFGFGATDGAGRELNALTSHVPSASPGNPPWLPQPA